ncbi:hypothetical protein LOY54_17545 [Pseudomonas sp. B21-032]|uniref:hypothetical protein n=1 Tax=Pseudomonas sp. B21-032 TaxID=2895483 RepID=UPI00215FFD03|nr:hypothetical protein [Pseudomonas sp. B21-032]UVL59843.1 hypothetical protein LOY54_17545 [Pseudomonas sp. B21-032]
MIYSSVLAAVVSALAAEAIDNTSKQAWQELYQPGSEDGHDLATLSRSVEQGGVTRMDADCWVFARLHSLLKPRHWDVLVAKFSTHKGRKVQSIGRLQPLVASHAPSLFIVSAVTAWAIPKLKGADGKRSSDMIVLPVEFYDINRWDPEARPERTRRRWKKGIEDLLEEMVTEALEAAAVILDYEGLAMKNAA